MTWLLSTKIGRSLASLGALLLAGLTFLTLDRRKTRMKEREDIRRRADASAEERRKERDQIDDDVRAIDAAAELRDKWTRPR